MSENLPDLGEVERLLELVDARGTNLLDARYSLIKAAGVVQQNDDRIGMVNDISVAGVKFRSEDTWDSSDVVYSNVPAEVFSGEKSVSDWADEIIKPRLAAQETARAWRLEQERRKYEQLKKLFDPEIAKLVKESL